MTKIAFWIIGVGCAGKSMYAKKLANKLDIHAIHLDCIRDRLRDGFTLEDGYRDLLCDKDDVIVIDGILPFITLEEMYYVKEYLKDYKIIYVLINPPYEKYLKNVEKRKKIEPEQEAMTETFYNFKTEMLKNLVRYRYVEIKKKEDLDQIEKEDIRNLQYQKTEHTKNKWNSLKVDCKDKSVLDLGCSACFYEEYSKEQGAKSYLGLDVNKAWIFNENARYFDLNNLELYKDTHDIVISTSMIHYIKDKEKFIKECARIAQDQFILECPLSKLDGLVLEQDPQRHDLFFPSMDLIKYWLGKYFNEFEIVGESPTEDDSYRIIFKAKKWYN